MSVAPAEVFGALPDGRAVERYWLENGSGMRVAVLTLGGIVQTIQLPRDPGPPVDVALGFDSVEDYVADGVSGAIVGRYANRIARGQFTLDGVRHQLPINAPPNHIHGGPHGFHRAVWSAERQDAALVLRLHSAAGDDGYPGALDVQVTYTLSDDDALEIAYDATADAPTIVNLTCHGYFNLAGEGCGDVLAHELTLGATRFTPVDAAKIPTGELRDVRGTPFDFTRPTPLGARLRSDDAQLAIGGGYDHNFVIDRAAGDASLAFAARLVEPRSGRWLEIHTTEPGLQLYTGQGLHTTGKHGHVYAPHAGVALETQHFPDSPNHPGFPSTILRPGERLGSRTVYRLG